MNFEIDLGPPSKEVIEWAKDNIGEDPNTKYQIVEELKDMIFSKGECEPHRIDDAFLLRFLRARHFIIPRAHRLLVNHYTFKETYPQLFNDINLRDLQSILDRDIFTVPPYRDQDGRRLLFFKIAEWNPNEFSVDDLFRCIIATIELALLEETIQILGNVVIMDLNNLSVQQAWYLTPNVAQKLIQIMVTSFPIRIHAFHIVNQPWLFETLFSVFKPFLNDTMKKRIHFHGTNMESLHKHVESKALPSVYGGVQRDVDMKKWLEILEKNEIIVKEMKSLGYET